MNVLTILACPILRTEPKLVSSEIGDVADEGKRFRARGKRKGPSWFVEVGPDEVDRCEDKCEGNDTHGWIVKLRKECAPE